MRLLLIILLTIGTVAAPCVYAATPLVDQCAHFDSASFILNVPCISVEESQYEADLSLIFEPPLPCYLDLVHLVQVSKTEPLCADFDIPTNHLTVPCLYAGSTCYSADLVLRSLQPVRFELLRVAETAGPEEIAALLNALRNEIVKTIPSATLQAVEAYVSAYPPQAVDQSAPIAVKASEGEVPELTVVVGRRDWAYASAGVEYTFLGIFGEGQASLLDTALWCFLEAALLRPDESEHLINIAFHLNERGQYVQAQRVLEFAQLLDPTSPGLNNNLAYALSKQGKALQAISKARTALNGGQNVSFFKERLGYYLQSADLDGAADLTLQPDSADTTNWREMVDVSLLSELGKSVYYSLLKVDQQFWEDVLGIPNPLDPDLNAKVDALYDLKMSHQSGAILKACVEAATAGCQSLDNVCYTTGFCKCKINGVLTSYHVATQIQALFWEDTRRRFIDLPLSMLAPALYQGLDLIDKAELREKAVILGLKLSDTDRSLLLDFWYAWYAGQYHYFESRFVGFEPFSFSDYITKRIWEPGSGGPILNRQLTTISSGDVHSYLACVSGQAEEQAREHAERLIQLALESDSLFAPLICQAGFCGPFRLQLSTPVIAFNINSRTGDFEVTVGSGVQFTAGWNLKKEEPILGIGYGVNLGNYIKASAGVKFKPSTGVVGTLNVGSRFSVPMPGGYYEPSVTELGQFWN